MKLNVLEDKKNRFVFELEGEDHTFCNFLVKELQKISDVNIATYGILHPLRRIPKIIIETKKQDPRNALKTALKNMKKINTDFLKAYEKA